MAEVYALFLGCAGALMRAAWLGPSTTFGDFADWPDFAVGYAPPEADDAILVVCRPGEGPEPAAADRDTWDVVRLAHSARRLPLLDVILVDGPRWRSLADLFD